MDVHAPNEPIHSWRDFLLHLATITVGLLIALSLEGAVEALHHRHIVREARENIRREMESNESEALKNIAYVQQDSDNMNNNMQRTAALLTNPHALDHGEMHFTFSWSSFNESAWRTARETGALTFMPTDEVQRYADIYNQQTLVNDQAVAIFTRQAEIAAPLLMYGNGATIPVADVHTLLYDCAVTHMRLDTLVQLIRPLDKQYAAALH